ncbi:MAG: helix-turn-helix transcriptional regulator [Firmicutes bacterium]|nr:helix-turn-helix transcriptional regulator [Bacillota bacterium]
MRTKYGLWPLVRIKEILEEKNLTQKELAEMMGETPQQVNKWVMGVAPCLSALGRMAITLGVKLQDLVWYPGDDTDFDVGNRVYIRGEILDTVQKETDGIESYEEFIEKILDVLCNYYRWTDEECSGVKVITYTFVRDNASKGEVKGEIVLGCVGEGVSDAFIAWAKKARDYMYRL